MIKRNTTWLVILLISLCWILPLQAQDEENDGAAVLVMIEANPGEGDALEAAIKDYHYWIADKPGHFRYNWYAVETGPKTGTYIARSGNHNWADFDAEYDWQDEANERFAANVAPHVASVTRVLTEEMKEFSYWPDDFSEYTHFNVTNWYIKSGQYRKFRAGLETIHKALTEGSYQQHFGFHSTVSGDKDNQVALVLPMKGYADFADNDPSFFDLVSEALGGPEAFQEFMEGFGSTFKAGDSFLVRRLLNNSGQEIGA
jgi:hypothetical protein